MTNRTYAQIQASASLKLQNAGNTIFATTELDDEVLGVLERLSQAKPWRPTLGSSPYSTLKQTVADAWLISLSDGDRWKKLWVDELRYEYNYPTSKRGFRDYENALELELDYAPASAKSVYLYLAKRHILQSAIGTSDTAGAVKTQGAVNDATVSLKSLGSGTINEDTKLTIAGDATIYHVISQATIGSNEATVSIWPPLQAIAGADAVVTLALESTVPDDLADLAARLIAARAKQSKATLLYQQAHSAITSATTAATAIGAIAARITQLAADAASARTQAGLAATAIILANTQFDLMDAQVDLGVTALSSGNSLLNTITDGSGAPEYMSQSMSDFGSARTFGESGRAYLNEAAADEANAASYLGAAAREAQAAAAKAQEAVASLSKGNLELAITRAGNNYRDTGMAEEQAVEIELRRMARPRVGEVYSRGR